MLEDAIGIRLSLRMMANIDLELGRGSLANWTLYPRLVRPPNGQVGW